LGLELSQLRSKLVDFDFVEDTATKLTVEEFLCTFFEKAVVRRLCIRDSGNLPDLQLILAAIIDQPVCEDWTDPLHLELKLAHQPTEQTQQILTENVPCLIQSLLRRGVEGLHLRFENDIPSQIPRWLTQSELVHTISTVTLSNCNLQQSQYLCCFTRITCLYLQNIATVAIAQGLLALAAKCQYLQELKVELQDDAIRSGECLVISPCWNPLVTLTINTGFECDHPLRCVEVQLRSVLAVAQHSGHWQCTTFKLVPCLSWKNPYREVSSPAAMTALGSLLRRSRQLTLRQPADLSSLTIGSFSGLATSSTIRSLSFGTTTDNPLLLLEYQEAASYAARVRQMFPMLRYIDLKVVVQPEDQPAIYTNMGLAFALCEQRSATRLRDHSLQPLDQRQLMFNLMTALTLLEEEYQAGGALLDHLACACIRQLFTLLCEGEQLN
jgi:hypothetical protein